MRFSLLLGMCLFLPTLASAATLSLEPSRLDLVAGQDVSVRVMLRSTESINTIGTAILLPAGLRLEGADRSGPIEQWVEVPTFDPKTSAVVFSGIIPHGWQGEATILRLSLRASDPGTYTLVFDPAQTELYRNDGQASSEPVVFGRVESSAAEKLLFALLFLGLAATLFFFRNHRLVVRWV